MSTDEQNPKVSRERLNQIASRKLAQLGVTTRPAADPQLLEGELPLTAGRVQNPVTKAQLTRARFLVWGHDHLRFLDPPLSGLKPIHFYDVDQVGLIEQRIVVALQKRVGGLRELEARFIALRMRTALDNERLLVKAFLETVSDTFELVGDPDLGVRVARVTASRGKPQDVPPDYPLIQLSEFNSGLDLELFLTDELPKMLQGVDKLKEVIHRPRAEPTEALQPLPPPTNALTLALLTQKLGADVSLMPGNRFELMQEFAHGGVRYRFQALHESGTTFRGRLSGPTGEKWSEKFELLRFPGAMQMVATVLGAKLPQAEGAKASGGGPPDITGADDAEGPGGQGHIAPSAGEIWLMNVLVEQDDGKEIRYACTDVDGKPYGATRLLKKADFQAVFVQQGLSWRLLILIDQVNGDQITYRQLNAARQPVGAAKNIAVGILLSNFIPEAAAY